MKNQELEHLIEENMQLSFTRSGGPGGQNVNKVNTKVTARLDLAALVCLAEEEIERLRLKLKNRINNLDQIVIQVQEKRTQARNRIAAVKRMKKIIFTALKKRKKRKKTKIPAAINEKRLKKKKMQSDKKRLRKI